MKLIGIETASPDIAAIFAERTESFNSDRIPFPTNIFAPMENPYSMKNFQICV